MWASDSQLIKGVNNYDNYTLNQRGDKQGRMNEKKYGALIN